MEGARGGGSVCQRSVTELAVEGFRMTNLTTVILEPLGPERTPRVGSAKGKNLNFCRVQGRRSRSDPLPGEKLLCPLNFNEAGRGGPSGP